MTRLIYLCLLLKTSKGESNYILRSECQDIYGTRLATDVLTHSISIIAISKGCYRDTGRRAIAPLEGRSRLLKGSYRRRRYAIEKCALAAKRRGYSMFAIQHGGWCASTKYAYRTYRKYGTSRKCRNGKGGPWANDVYVVKG